MAPSLPHGTRTTSPGIECAERLGRACWERVSIGDPMGASYRRTGSTLTITWLPFHTMASDLHPHTRSPPLPTFRSPAPRQAPPPNAPLLTLCVSRASCSLYPVRVPALPCSTCARWCRTSALPHPWGAHRRRQRQGEPCWQGRRQECLVVSPPCNPFVARVRPLCSMRPRGAV